ncbi:hypothetical protein HMPREF9141_0787 [Prevotella multiformis DSM 16608]|uniref:Uncharacterized protein n=1 Tax=Prevotella multiformis DSM 16608 TaxID=888743 RepID=F0F5C1_9BACT|nr:hypothetical protein HMPREF9141_0787 [Prevotella multiformis DSM 16608]
MDFQGLPFMIPVFIKRKQSTYISIFFVIFAAAKHWEQAWKLQKRICWE